MEFPIRINKYIAHQGWASRREADALILRGGVLVNDTRATLGQKIEANDRVILNAAKPPRCYFAYYKGRGIISHSPAAHEVDIATRLKQDYGLTDVYPVGRLDKDSEGLMILTNDGRVTGPLLDPTATHEKEYEVTVDKNVTGLLTNNFEKGVKIEGYKTKPARAYKNEHNPKKFNVILTEGKKHQIRRMCAALGYQVQSLKRVRIMQVQLGALKPNQYRKLTGDELTTFLAELNIQK